MKIALCQINTIVADVEGNVRKILDWAERAKAAGAEMAVFPELTVTGYPPKDLLMRADFVESIERAVRRVAAKAAMPVLIGATVRNRTNVGKPLFNAAMVIDRRQIRAVAKKMLIPTYDVFDESRYFEPGEKPVLFRAGRTKIGITICEDIWNDSDFWPTRLYRTDPVGALVRDGADVIVNLSASPFELGKADLRRRMISAAAKKYKRPILQVNLVGGNDELLFDGNSLAINRRGEVQSQGAAFREDLVMVDTDSSDEVRFSRPGRAEEAFQALVMGTQDYAQKTGFKSAVIGLSGGIDSSVTACIAAEALGPRNVLGVMMPGPFSSAGSVEDSRILAKTLGIQTQIISIVPLVKAATATLEPVFRGLKRDATEENIQARMRGVVLMALSNKFGHLLLTTGNKSEMSVGYCTLYGDMCGGLAVISDVPKMLVYGIGRHINTVRRIIPESVFRKAPSAELRPNQTDQDSLPPYPSLDAFIDAYVERLETPEKIRVRGMSAKACAMWAKKIDAAEYKRKQAPPGLKITSRAFGAGRREPIARKI